MHTCLTTLTFAYMGSSRILKTKAR
jgi:hypothetical protein